MKVKCTECGKEFNLEKGENPSDFQCDCGGNLKSLFDIKKNRPQQTSGTGKTSGNGSGLTDWWNKQSTNTKAGLGLGGICCIGLLIILVIFAMGPDKNTQNQTQTTTTTTTQNPSQQTNTTSSSFQTLKLSGTGQQATQSFNWPGGLMRITMTHNGNSNFIIKLMDSSTGKTEEYAVNEIGNFSGTKAFSVPAGSYIFDITADGPWTITVSKG